MPDHPARPRRPVFFAPAALEAHGGTIDPIAQLEAAHATAAVLVHTGRAARDPEVTARLVHLVDELGIETVAELWSSRPAHSLPGALWRLYALHTWVTQQPAEASADYAAGVRFAEVNHVVAGIAEPPGPAEVRTLSDEILRGVFDGDLAVALDRAAAFCRVVSAGQADRGEGVESVTRAGNLLAMAGDLTACARLWRAGDLT